MAGLLDLSRRPGSTFALIAVTLLCLVAIAAPLIAPYGPNAIAPGNQLMDPPLQHLLGTDHLGRDILSRPIYGARVALGISLSVIAISRGARATDHRHLHRRYLRYRHLVSEYHPGAGRGLWPRPRQCRCSSASCSFLISAASPAPKRSPSAIAPSSKPKGFSGGDLSGNLHHVTPNIIGPIFVLARMDISRRHHHRGGPEFPRSWRAPAACKLRALRDRLGLSYLLISHNLNVVVRVTDGVAVMYLGHRRKRANGRIVSRSATSLYAGASLGQPDARSRSPPRAHRAFR
ncbi:hypothetical protein J2W42_003981 [Rhizobium tibeticum]|uniref:hypothetical protein n=1 Tax=Rhizobium tibeticum TaxID=501024 RepID=UPI00278774E2|nr:hypothetical protein [Rhizobium tibeticum]MDP9811118.1 hypothetical protein [Rhizobium tibeticum]